MSVGAAREGSKVLRACYKPGIIQQYIYPSKKSGDITVCVYTYTACSGGTSGMAADERGDHDPCVHHPPLAPCLCDSECHWGGLLPAAAAEAKRRRFCHVVSFETGCSRHELLPPSILGGDTITAEEAEKHTSPREKRKQEEEKEKKTRPKHMSKLLKQRQRFNLKREFCVC